MKITKHLTPYNFKNASRKKKDIKYIVIHYVGATGGALANVKYYASKYIGASAHYFVGHAGEIYQSVLDEDIAWHCGGGLQGKKGATFHKICTNTNSIGIEMCIRNSSTASKDRIAESKTWYFEKQTVDVTVELTKYLMNKYDIDIDHVIRHHDVTGKYCPSPYVRDEKAWSDFKKRLVAKKSTTPTPTKPITNNVIGYVKSKVNDLNLRTKPNWNNNSISGKTANINDVFDAVDKVKVGNSYMYLLTNGLYISASDKYVSFFTEKEKTKTKYVKVLVDNLNIRKSPSWDEDAICGVVRKNEVFTVVGEVKVGNSSMYRLKSGVYISTNSKYVKYFTK